MGGGGLVGVCLVFTTFKALIGYYIFAKVKDDLSCLKSVTI